MELSGRPGAAEFYSPKWGRSPDSYNLTWKIDSYPPLEEVRLLYRRVQVSGRGGRRGWIMGGKPLAIRYERSIFN